MKLYFLFITTIFLLFCSSIFSQVNTERFREDADTIGFSGYIDLEGILATGNSDFQLISVGSRLNYNWGNDYTFIIADGGYGWDKGKAFVDQTLAHLRHVITTSEFLQIEFFTQFDNNKKRLLDERELIGGGLRFRIIKTDNFKFRIGTGYMFENEKYNLPENSIHPHNTSFHRFTSYVTLKFDFDESLSFISTSYYQPHLKEFNDYRLFSENAIVVDASKILGFL